MTSNPSESSLSSEPTVILEEDDKHVCNEECNEKMENLKVYFLVKREELIQKNLSNFKLATIKYLRRCSADLGENEEDDILRQKLECYLTRFKTYNFNLNE